MDVPSINKLLLDKWLTLDSLCQIGFGKTLDLVERAENRFIIDVLHSFSSAMGVYVQFPDLAKLRLEMLAQLVPSIREAREKCTKLSKDFESSVLQVRDQPQRSLFSRILGSMDQRIRRNFPEPELWAEGVFLMLAGESRTNSTMQAHEGSRLTLFRL